MSVRTDTHVAKKNTRLDSIKKDSLCACATISGTGPEAVAAAFLAAYTAFFDEWGRMPVPERVRFAGFVTSFDSVAEVIEEPA